MKKLYLIKDLFGIIFTILVIYIYYKGNIVYCETDQRISTETFLALYEELTKELSILIKNPNFINKYGRSNYNPAFLTIYYTKVICDPEFVRIFLDNLQLHKREITPNFDKEILELFEIYVETSIKAFELKIKRFIMLFINIKPIYLMKGPLLDITSDIITPIAKQTMYLFGSKSLHWIHIVGILCIAASLY